MCIHDIFEYSIHSATAISSMTLIIAGYISKLTLTALKQFRLRLFYVVAAVLGVVILYTYITLAGLFVVYAMMTAYDHLLSVSTAVMVFYGALWLWIPAIYVFCRHLLLGYMIAIVPITAFEFVYQGYISIPSYPWLWAILITWQVWCFVLQGSGSIACAVRAIGTMATICIVLAP